MKEENRKKVLSEAAFLKSLFDIFKFQIPVELHENALYAVLNILQDCPKQVKQQIYQLNLVSPLLKFIGDLYVIETEVLRSKENLIVFSDFKIEWNPEFSNTKITHNKDLTLAEMQ